MTKKNQTPANSGAAAAVATPAVQTTSRGKFVSVGSKLPFPLLLQLQRPDKRQVVGRHGSVDETVYVFHGKQFEVKGNAYPNGNELPKGFPRRPEMVEDQNGGYAITKGIPADFWAEWVSQNAETEMVKNGLIMAQTDIDSLAAAASDFAKVDSGLAAINPDMDASGRPIDRRSPRPIKFGVSDVKEEPRTKAA